MSANYNLGDVALSTALTNSVITAGADSAGNAQALIDGLSWMAAVTLFCNFSYGGGGTSCAVVVQTSLDGLNWIDIARFDFTTASLAKVANLSGLLSKAVTTIAVLAGEGVTDGVLGDRLRAKVSSIGTYSGNTTVSVRAAVR